jgi:Spy/CpxP family protein refolding chaperone
MMAVKKFSFWIVFSLIIVFAAGIAAGIFGERLFFAKRPEARRPGGPHPPTLERWSKELGLTAEQRERIREIFKKNEERIKDLKVDFDKHQNEIRAQLKSEIDAVLTAEQKQKLESMIQKHMEDMRKQRGERQRRPDSRPKQNPNKESDNEKEANHRSGDSGGYRGSHPGLRPY